MQANQETYHVISRQKLLQELCLLVHDSFDDKLVILGNVEHRTAGSWVRQLDQWLITQRVLQRTNKQNHNYWFEIHIDKPPPKKLTNARIYILRAMAFSLV